MRVDGKYIASLLHENLKQSVANLQKRGITPKLAIILIGNNPSSHIYVQQKIKLGESLSIPVVLFNKLRTASQLRTLVSKLNSDSSFHGIIIQRPVPLDITTAELDSMVIPKKDIDGLHPNSLFVAPVCLAIVHILRWIHLDLLRKKNITQSFDPWLKKQRVGVFGRGETGGKPIAAYLQKHALAVWIFHSKTPEAQVKELTHQANILISCVGKSNIVRREHVSEKTILIGVGMHEENKRFYADYDVEEMEKVVLYVTPVPKGVGPVNVICLFANLVSSATQSLTGKN